jgi:hypothetical protein
MAIAAPGIDLGANHCGVRGLDAAMRVVLRPSLAKLTAESPTCSGAMLDSQSLHRARDRLIVSGRPATLSGQAPPPFKSSSVIRASRRTLPVTMPSNTLSATPPRIDAVQHPP